ncbi:alpha-N-acetylneuraminide alpha-2,8-sialyltransferase-like [Branchiostoma floridae]|uniref:Alpha-N-acetylneuraminide alpha-2,8-sialyltransferase-like n=2 Tax=Branchiostoma floridae TaxID=7739 RepID=A0A9J7LSK0_BRAFL|nr:alpha-N-acetylneuraminide alpha-2,8-sialyltransferase-like [Branchiostoma floridae]
MAKVRIHRTFTLGLIMVSLNICFVLVLQKCVLSRNDHRDISERDVSMFESLPAVNSKPGENRTIKGKSKKPKVRSHKFTESTFNWTDFNQTAVEKLRHIILNRTWAKTHLYCSQFNIPVHSNLTFFESNKVIKVMRGTYQHFPRKVEFPKVPYRTCAVIGNSGVLLNSKCGREIDSFDYIFRLNLPPVGPLFHPDVGHRAHFVTINPSILTERFKYLTDEDEQKLFLRSVLAYRTNATFYTHPFHNPLYRKTAYRAMFLVRDSGNGSVVRWSHPDFLRRINDFWKKIKGIKEKRITSGLMVTTFALSMCEETHLYGFWPYSMDLRKKKSVPYHYFKRSITVQHKVVKGDEIFRKVVDKNLVHNMAHEFSLLVKMHKQRLLRLHVKPCK